ncbi:Hypothetical_protein [Hexamita inflata]|uniref:Hypothetical_protein n=1 Tax=Hexamita inflata TaxID=28002 RepID=A0AA86PM35_9EUKA|nr:Hypothetical protein HINF_LOCUS29616 [Hexamita inflata]
MEERTGNKRLIFNYQIFGTTNLQRSNQFAQSWRCVLMVPYYINICNIILSCCRQNRIQQNLYKIIIKTRQQMASSTMTMKYVRAFIAIIICLVNQKYNNDIIIERIDIIVFKFQRAKQELFLKSRTQLTQATAE